MRGTPYGNVHDQRAIAYGNVHDHWGIPLAMFMNRRGAC
jgi:hypothetical protein